MEIMYWVYRNGRFLSEVSALNEIDAIDKAQDMLIIEKFGQAGAMTEDERFNEERFMGGDFKAVVSDEDVDPYDLEECVIIEFKDLSAEKQDELKMQLKKSKKTKANMAEYYDDSVMAMIYYGNEEGWWNN